MKLKTFKYVLSSRFFVSAFPSSVFFLTNLIWLLPHTPPSDPLQYAAPALVPDGGFAFLDRIVVWLWIRFFTLFPIEPYFIDGVATLSCTSLILAIASWWLVKNVGILASSLFTLLFILPPISLGIASYTYPMQLMTLVLLITVLVINSVPRDYLPRIGGFGYGVALLCKIQAYSFGLFLLMEAVKFKTTLKRIDSLVKMGAYSLLGIAFVFALVAFLDGTLAVYEIIFGYLGDGMGQDQIRGRGLGGLPPFLDLFQDPSSFAVILGIATALILVRDEKIRRFATVALIQGIGIFTIYYVTDRGGPLITNYWYDTYVFGIIAFSSSVQYLIKKYTVKFDQQFARPLSIGIYFLALLSLVTATVEYEMGSNTIYRPIMMTGLVISFIGIALTRPISPTSWPACLAIYLAITPILQTTKGSIIHIHQKMDFSRPFHKAAQLVHSLPKEKIVWTRVQFARPTSEDPSWRAADLYFQTYMQTKDRSPLRVFSKVKPDEFHFLVTDDYQVVKEYAPMATPYERSIWLVDIENKTFTREPY